MAVMIPEEWAVETAVLVLGYGGAGAVSAVSLKDEVAPGYEEKVSCSGEASADGPGLIDGVFPEAALYPGFSGWRLRVKDSISVS